MPVSDPVNGWGHQDCYPDHARLGWAPWPDWSPIGPDCFPDAVLGARIRLAGVTFQLLAMRVHSPNTAGWTGESDRLDADEGMIVWNLPGERRFYHELSQLPEDSPEPPEPEEPERTQAMTDWERWWRGAQDNAFGWIDDGMVPVRFPERDGAYVVAGYPTEDDPSAPCGALDGSPCHAPTTPDPWWEMNGLIQVGDGLLLVLNGVRARAVATNQATRLRPQDPESADMVEDWTRVITESPQPGALRTLPYEDARWISILSSVPHTVWDRETAFAAILEAQPATGANLWCRFKDGRSAGLTDAEAGAWDTLVAAIRKRHLARDHRGGAVLVTKPDECDHVEGLKALFWQGPGIEWISHAGTKGVGNLFLETYKTGNRFVFAPSGSLLQLVDRLDDYALFGLLNGDMINVADTDFLDQPEWVADLPPLLPDPDDWLGRL